MTESNNVPEANDAERQELLTQYKNLGLITDDELARISSESPEESQKSIDELVEKKKRLQDDFRQLITIKDVIEKYLSRLISDMLDGRDVIESLRQGMEIYPSLGIIRWLVGKEERDLTEFVKALDLDSVDSNAALPILYRWRYEYKPLYDIWLELSMREQGRKNHWTGIEFDRQYDELRHTPQVSIQLKSRQKTVWNAREDIDDIAALARGLLNISLRALSGIEKQRSLDPGFIENMNMAIRDTEESINQLKALPILSSQNVSEDSTKIEA